MRGQPKENKIKGSDENSIININLNSTDEASIAAIPGSITIKTGNNNWLSARLIMLRKFNVKESKLKLR